MPQPLRRCRAEADIFLRRHLYISDWGLQGIVEVPRSGTPSLIGLNVILDQPVFLSTDPAGNVYIPDQVLNRVYRMSPAEVATLIGGTGCKTKMVTAAATSAAMNQPQRVAMAPDGTLYVTDANVIRKISPNSIVFSTATNVGSASDQTVSVFNIGNLPYSFASSFTFAQKQMPKSERLTCLEASQP